MDTVWYLYRSGSQIGPMSLEDLKSVYATQSITEGDLYWKEGMPAWEAVTLQLIGKQQVVSTPTVVLQPPASALITKIPEQKTVVIPAITPVAPITPVLIPTETPAMVAPIIQAPIISSDLPITAEIETKDFALAPSPSGLGGWLIPIVILCLSACLLSFLGLTWLIANLNSVLGIENADAWKLTAFTCAGLLGGLIAVLWTFNLLKNLFLKKVIFPAQFRSLLGLPLLGSIALLAFSWMQRNGSSTFTEPIGTINSQPVPLFGIEINPALLTLGIALLVIGLIVLLTLYSAKSKRVKHTFVN